MFKNVITFFLFWLLFGFASSAQTLNPKLDSYCKDVVDDLKSVSIEKAHILDEIAVEIFSSVKQQNKCRIVFICTHNSRRSHMAELWFHTAAMYYGISNIKTFSGGTEATAFNKNAVDALERVGFMFLKSDSLSSQTAYKVSLSASGQKRLMFSKKYDHKVNPQEDFIAVMVCSEADKGCPIVSGAKARFSLPYNDPRLFDNHPDVKEKYDETCSLIAHEMFYLANKLKQMADSNK
jgi:protein-tyrosine-phosphatase